MKELGVRSIVVKKYRPYSNKKTEDNPKLENKLNRDFSTTKINQKWVSDITYIHTEEEGWCYLASILDLHTNKIIGWSFDTTMTTELVITALERAKFNTNLTTENEVLLHSDQGSQYTSNDYRGKAEEFQVSLSYSKKGCPYDNAVIESFHAVIKKEYIYQTNFKNFQEAKRGIFEYIESWYNRFRIQEKLNYMSPVQYEESLKVA